MNGRLCLECAHCELDLAYAYSSTACGDAHIGCAKSVWRVTPQRDWTESYSARYPTPTVRSFHELLRTAEHCEHFKPEEWADEA